ncbi:penicillin-binding protein 1A [Sphingobacterium sp. FBM7-1]|uniref:penicillin-binding protein 1A n=1 Tax=Sphingobacterium sp. FBM7-1 TaxID=2886688 RepID=UPI001D0F748F|nr:transglycosylase domain-containing protein [Sphingobacterium sp. FBM7-1]MCC2600678.1 penicillin-binding protein [Sphingobacterium sp. FBM7-1]
MFKRVKNKVIRLLLIAVYSLIILVCAVQLNFLWLFGYSPTKNDILLPTLHISSELYTADSVLIGRYFEEDRDPVSFDSISVNLLNALVATEDVRFYRHKGVDFIGLFSSLVSTLRGDKRGGSTITQQLAKNLYRTRYNQSQGALGYIPGVRMGITKFKEWMTAYKLESKYEKNEIITMYLNTVSFSNNAYGIKSASLRYFNKQPSELSAPESAVLIGMLKGTTLYNPIRNPDKSKARRNIVLSQMQKEGYINNEQYIAYSKEPLILNVNSSEREGTNDSYLRAAVQKWLEKWSEENDVDIYTAGLKIYTTIDSRMQKLAEETVAEQMDRLQDRLDNTWRGEEPWRDKSGVVIPGFLEDKARKLPVFMALMEKFNGEEERVFEQLRQPKKMKVFTWEGDKEVEMSTMDSLKHYVSMLNTGMMAMNPYNGEIKVWVGGINHRYYKFDHVNQAKRQAGSTFKPFVYLTALEAGMEPCDTYEDKPVRLDFVNDEGEKEIWEPKNADWTFSHRDMSLRWAMARSLNTITAQITMDVGWDKIVETAHRVGINSHLASVPSVGLGSNDVSVFEMVNAYATFMNEGKRVEPILVSEIYDNNGELIASFKTTEKQVVDPENAWLMTYMLRGTIEEPGGTSQALWEWDLFGDENQIGGKTGTSSDYVDGWYMGVAKDLVSGVWVGCDEQSIRFKNSQTGEGSKTALPIYAAFMEKLYRHPELGVTKGKFPDSKVEILKKYNCPSPRIRTVSPPDSVNTELDREERGLQILLTLPEVGDTAGNEIER